MNKFSKFFPNNEVRLVIYTNEHKYKLFFYLLFIVLIFFLLFPLWRLGHYGVLLWLSTLLVCLIFLSNHLLRRNTIYIVTNDKIWHIFYISDQNIKLRGAINILDIINIQWRDNDLFISTASGGHFLRNIKKTEEIMVFFNQVLLSKEGKSGII